VPDHSTLWWFGRRHLSPSVAAAVMRGKRRLSGTLQVG
jgi:hypothetical protein